jgi:lipopolysaccharide export system ATP-binding protein
MSAPEWVAALGDRDPSVAIALAAITRAAGPNDVASFADLIMSYREAHLACYRAIGTAAEQEITGDEVRDHLRNSVLPRLAVEGWLVDTSASEWEPVQPRVAWWGTGDEDRQAIYDALLAAAGRAAQRSAQRSRPATPRRTSTSVLEGTRLVKSFKDRRVVNEVSVKVEQGEIVGLLGPNGAGKTTTFYLITGLIRPDAGQVRLDGLDLTRAPMYERARAGIGYLAQEPSIFRKMTVEENILAILETRRLGREQRQRELDRMLDELSIKHLRRSRAYSLSGGERRRLEITRALVTEPKFMLLDEPFAGVDPIAVHDIQTIVAGLRHRGIGVLITDHNVEQTLDIVDRAYIMFEGKVQAAGKVSELVYDDRVAQLYLGPTLTARLRARLESVA